MRRNFLLLFYLFLIGSTVLPLQGYDIPPTSICLSDVLKAPQIREAFTSMNGIKVPNLLRYHVKLSSRNLRELSSESCMKTFQNLTSEALPIQQGTLGASYVFLLFDGSQVKAGDLSSIQKLLDVLPYIVSINSQGFLDWVESMDADKRREVLAILNGVPFDGDATDAIEKLYHFQAIETQVNKMQDALLGISSGKFIEDLAKMSEIDATTYKLSKLILRKSMKAYIDNMSEIKERVASISINDLENPSPYAYQDLINALVEGLASGSYAGLQAIFGDFDSLDTGELLLQFGAEFSQVFLSILCAAFSKPYALSSFISSVYGLVNNIQDLVKGNMDALEIAIIAIDLIRNTISIVAYILAVALDLAFPGMQLGLIVAVIELLLQTLLMGVQVILRTLMQNQIDKMIQNQLDAIEFTLPLTDEERKTVEEQLKNGKPIDRDLLDLMKQKSANNALVDAVLASLSQNNMNMVKRYVFPAFEVADGNTPNYYIDNQAYLDRSMTEIVVARYGPHLSYRPTCNPLKFGKYIDCAPEFENGNCGVCDRISAYRCVKAIGVKYTTARDSDAWTLIDLKNGTDTAYGMEFEKNLFMVNAGKKNYFGGENNDTFIIQNPRVEGTLDGGGGSNILLIEEDEFQGTIVYLDLHAQTLEMNTGNNNYRSNALNFPVVLGRRNNNEQESFVAGCQTTAIVGNGGYDMVTIPDINCYFDIFVEADKTTKVLNSAKEGKFVYRITNNSTGAEILIENFGENTQHVVFFDVSYKTLTGVFFSNDTEILSLQLSPKSATVSMDTVKGDEAFRSQPAILTNDRAIIQVSRDNFINIIYDHVNDTTDIVSAHDFADCTIIANANAAQFLGKKGNDTFVIKNSEFSGYLEGGGGISNHLILDKEFSNSELTIDMSAGIVKKADGLELLRFSNMQQFTGAIEKSDNVIANCDTSLINCQNGTSASLPNVILIKKESKCNYSMIVRLGGNSNLENFAEEGKFIYSLPWEHNINFKLTFKENITHAIRLEFPAKSIKNVTVGLENTTIALESFENHSLKIPVYQNSFENGTEEYNFYEGPVILTNETALIRIGFDGRHHLLFNITKTTALVEGSPAGQNSYILWQNAKTIIGGNASDIFVINSTNLEITGLYDGQGGINRLIVDSNYRAQEDLTWDLTGSGREELLLLNVNELMGRTSRVDVAICDCNTTYIDLLEGKIGNPDIIVFPRVNCSYSTKITYRLNTVIDNEATKGNFVYTIVENHGAFDFLTDVTSLNHTAVINLNQTTITNVTFSNVTHLLTFDNTDNTTCSIKFQEIEEGDSYCSQPRVLSTDLIEFKINKDGNPVSFINVVENYTIGFSFIRNTFIIHVSDTNVTGGDFDDVFIFLYANKTAFANAQGGEKNVLLFNSTDETKSLVLVSGYYLEDVEQQGEGNIIFKNFSTVVGRENYGEKIVIDCDVETVDGRSGMNDLYVDYIYVPEIQSCNYTRRVNILIKNYTSVKSSAKTGFFFYQILNKDDDFDLDCDQCINATHAFALLYNTSEIESFHFNLTGPCSISTKIVGSQKIQTYALSNSVPCTFPRLLTSDLVDVSFTSWLGLRTTRGNYLGTGETAEELIERWLPVATRLNTTISSVANVTDELVVIARNGGDILWSSPERGTHLVGNRQNNIFVINKGQNDTLSRVHIYSFKNSTNLVDCSQLVKPVRDHKMPNSQIGDPLYLPEVTLFGQNLKIFIESSQNSHAAEIILVDYREFYENVTFTLNQSPMMLKEISIGFWSMVPIPVPFNASILVVDQENLEDNQEFIFDIPCNGDNVVTYTGDHLIVSNIFSNNTASNEFVTIVFDSYFSTNAKMKKAGKNCLPSNVQLQFKQGESVNLDKISPSQVEDVLSVLIKEKEKLDGEIFGFVCKTAGIFPHPRHCNVYYECIHAGNDIVQYEFTCPPGTLFCKAELRCGLQAQCPCM